MVLERSLSAKSQIGPATALDTSPNFSIYLITCDVEGKTPWTRDTYTQRVGSFLRSVYPKTEEDITADDIRQFLYSLKQGGLNPSTLNAYYRAIRSYFSWLLREARIKKDPMLNLKAPKIPRVLIKPFSKEDIHALIRETSRPRFLDARNRALVFIFLDTGLRLCEMAQLTLDDVDIKTGVIKVMGKGSKERNVIIQRETRKALWGYLCRRDDSHKALWVSEEKRPMTRDGIRVTIVKLCQRAGISGVKCGPHTFRHTAAIQCLRNGMNVFVLQMMLGHSTLTMVKRYLSYLGMEDLQREHQKASPVDNL